MASKKKSRRSVKKNPVLRAELTPRSATYEERAKGPKQRGLFKYREVHPGEEGLPGYSQGGSSREVPMLPSEPDAGRMLHRPGRAGQGVVDPVEDDFVYEEYPEPTRPYRPLKHDLTTAQGGHHGLLFQDADAMHDELDELSDELKSAINDGLQAKEDSMGDADVGMEDRFNEWLAGADDEYLITTASDRFVVFRDMLNSIENGVEDDDGEYMARAVEVLRDRSNWGFNTSGVADWEEEDDEFQINFSADDISVDVDVTNLETGEVVNLRTGEDVVLHARDLFQVIEADEGLGQEALELWLEAIVQKSDASTVEVKWQKPREARSKSRPGVPEVEFTGYITVRARARMLVGDIENGLQEILDEIENLPENGDEDVADEGEQDVVAKRERVAARTDATVQLPFTFESVENDGGDLVGGDWTVWNLSSADLRAEGKAMAHCSGDEGMRYAQGIEDGNIWIWSVRDGDKQGRAGKSKFTLQVERKHGDPLAVDPDADVVAGFTQVKGKGNRLPGWAYKRDYPPYGPHAYEPRVEPYEERTKAGPILHKPISAKDVRREEVLLLWQLIKEAAPLEGLVVGRPLYHGPKTWDEVEQILSENTEDSYDGVVLRTPARKVIEIWCKDMLPGLMAVFSGVLFNDPRRTNPRRGPVARVHRMQGTTFDLPYDRYSNRWM